MTAGTTGVVANTDEPWFRHFRPLDELRRVKEVNFWRPSATNRFRAALPGEPIFFRLKKPHYRIAGGLTVELERCLILPMV